MKKSVKELDVDFIGGHDLLTEKDFQIVSALIKADRDKKNPKTKNRKATRKLKPISA